MSIRKSKLEDRFETLLRSLNVPFNYEVTKISYTVPESKHTYTVDWTVNGKALYETKGFLSDHTERNKYILIKQQYPDIDLRFVFENPNKLCGGMKQTHAEWAIKQGFRYCSIKDYETIEKWVNETSCNS